MEKIKLGQTGLKVSRLGLGTVKFGRNDGVKYPEGFKIPQDSELVVLLELAKSLGINLLDTAPAYGTSEERLGKLLKGQREDWVIVGKAGEEFKNGKSSYHFTSDHFKRSLNRSLERLGTDYLDVLMIHSDGRDMDILNNDDLIKTMHGFKEQRLVKAIGASTKTRAGGIKALELMDVVMATYTSDYQDEKVVLDYAAEHNKGVILKKALSSGHADNMEDALKFSFSHPAVNSIIVGTISPKHLRENVAMTRAAVPQAEALHGQA
ncbi:MAG: aldo/keto reductase [Alphaproteobacteria bacterium]|nr:aldo/keto reductase [Alphaproteobacteria bacterium]